MRVGLTVAAVVIVVAAGLMLNRLSRHHCPAGQASVMDVDNYSWVCVNAEPMK